MYSISAPALLTASLTVMISVEVSVICACTELPTHDNRWWCAARNIQLPNASHGINSS